MLKNTAAGVFSQSDFMQYPGIRNENIPCCQSIYVSSMYIFPRTGGHQAQLVTIMTMQAVGRIPLIKDAARPGKDPQVICIEPIFIATSLEMYRISEFVLQHGNLLLLINIPEIAQSVKFFAESAMGIMINIA
jgi:hypothetical protein